MYESCCCCYCCCGVCYFADVGLWCVLNAVLFFMDSLLDADTVKPFNLAALEVGHFSCKILAPLFWRIKTI